MYDIYQWHVHLKFERLKGIKRLIYFLTASTLRFNLVGSTSPHLIFLSPILSFDVLSTAGINHKRCGDTLLGTVAVKNKWSGLPPLQLQFFSFGSYTWAHKPDAWSQGTTTTGRSFSLLKALPIDGQETRACLATTEHAAHSLEPGRRVSRATPYLKAEASRTGACQMSETAEVSRP